MASIADVYVTVLPETGQIAKGIEKALRDVDKHILAAKKRWKKELDDLGFELDADTTKAEKKIDEVEKKAEKKKPKVTVEVDADATQADKAIDKAVNKKKPKVKVEAEVEFEKSAMDKLQDEADALLKKMEIDLDEVAMRNKFNKLRGDVEKSLSKVGVKLNESLVRHQLNGLTSEVERLFGADRKVNIDFDPSRGVGNLNALFGNFAGKLGELTSHIKDAEVDVDIRTKTAERQLAVLRRNAEKVFDHLGVDVDTAAAYAELVKLRWEAEKILGDLDVDVDTSKAHAEILGLERVIHEMDNTVTVDVEYDREALQRKVGIVKAKVKVEADESSLKQVTGQIKGVFGAIGDAFGPGAVRIPGTPALIPLGLAVEGIGLLPNLVPVIGQVVSAVGQLSGVLGLLPGVIGTAGLAMGSLKIATAGFGDAIKEIGDPEKFAEAVAQLTPNAQQAALAIQSLMPQITQLKSTVQDAFFAGFGEQIKNLGTTYLPMFQTTLSQFAAIANRALTGVSEMLQTPEMSGNIQAILNNLASGFNILAGAVKPIVQAFTDIMLVSSQFMPGLSSTITEVAHSFANFIREARDSGDLAGWIQGGIDAFTSLKNIVVNTWNILKGLFASSMGPEGAGGLLTSIENLTTRWSEWVNSVEGQNKLADFFRVAKEEFEKWWPVLQDLPGLFWNLFNAISDAIGLVMPIIRGIVAAFEEWPGLIYAVIGGFVTLKALGIAVAFIELAGAIAAVKIAFGGLPGAAATAGTGMASNLTKGLSGMGFIRAAAGWSLPIAVAVAITYSILKGDTANQPAGPPAPLFDPGQWANPTPNAPPGSPAPRTYGPNATSQEPFRAPGMAPGWPDSNLAPGTILDHKVSGAVPVPGSAHDWMIPYLVPDPHSTGGRYLAHPPSPASGGREPEQNLPFAPAAPPAPPMPTPAPSSFLPPAPVPSGGPGGGGSGSNPDAVSPVPGAPYSYGGFGELNWEALAEKESGGNWSMNTGNGKFGGLQFDQATWEEFGGKKNFADRADLASKNDQIKVATALYNKRGTGPWPTWGWLLTATDDQLKSVGLTSAGNPRSGYGSGGYGSGGQFVGSGDPRLQLSGTGNKGEQVRITPSAQFVGEDLLQKFPNISEIGTVRPDKFQWHPSGRGLDVNWPGDETPEGKAQGDVMAAYLNANKEALGIANVLWQVADHFDHIHVSLKEGMSPALQQATSQDSYSYDGPGGDRNNPMYTENTKDTGGKQLGKDIVTGIGEIFGLGELFKDPTQFGLFKIFKGLTEFGLGVAKSRNQDQDNGGDFGLGGGGSGGGSFIDSLISLVPQPFGDLNTGSPENAPGEFIPGLSEGGGGSLANFMAGFVPPGPGQQVNDNSFNVSIGNTTAPTKDVEEALDHYLFPHLRTATQNSLPVPG